MASVDDDESDDEPAAKRYKEELRELQEDYDDLHGKYKAACDDRDSEREARIDAEAARNKFSLECSRLRWKYDAATATIAALQERVRLLQGEVGEHPAAYVPDALMAAAGGAGAGATGPGGRNIQACKRCREMQRKCDGDGVNSCSRCSGSGECVYLPPAKRGPKPKR